MDTITLSQEDVDRLFEWRDNHKEYVRKFKSVMTEGRIILGGFHEQVFKDELSFYRYKVYHHGKLVHELVWNKATKIGKTVESTLKTDLNKYNESIISLHASIMAYMEYYSDMKEYVQVSENRVQKKKKKSNGKPKKNAAVKIKKVYRISIPKDATVMDKRRYNRVMEKWSVRGHWRNYKSGKKVWIEPQVRGQGENVTPKNYTMGDK